MTDFSLEKSDVLELLLAKWKFHHWLILSQFFHKLKNIVKFYKEFILGIIEPIKLKISPFCHFCDQKREFNVILINDIWLMCFTTGAFQIPKSRKCDHIQSCVIHQNSIRFSFLMTKVTKCWNLHVDTFNNNEYKSIAERNYVF